MNTFKDKLDELMKNFINAPCKFEGSDLVREANQQTHHWVSSDEVVLCLRCDCRYGSYTADWPCGYPVPRTNDLQ